MKINSWKKHELCVCFSYISGALKPALKTFGVRVRSFVKQTLHETLVFTINV